MPTIRFQVTIELPTDRVLGALTDFSDRRPAVWPNSDRAHWKGAAGEVTATASESDTWAPGSQWQYRLLPTRSGGTREQGTVVRNGRGLRVLLIGALITRFGVRILRSDIEKELRRVR